MATIIGCVGQKGGQAKSGLARTLAVVVARAGMTVDVADLDAGQGTVHEWAQDRLAAGLQPAIGVRLCQSLDEALSGGPVDADVIIVDGPARADSVTLELARRADLLVQPTGASLDDLRPAVRTFNGLVERGVPGAKLLLALTRIGSAAEAAAAREYLTAAGYAVANGFIPERVSYRSLLNAGMAFTEARHASLREAAGTVIQSIVDAAVEAASQDQEAA